VFYATVGTLANITFTEVTLNLTAVPATGKLSSLKVRGLLLATPSLLRVPRPRLSNCFRVSP
jgi:hypothetical protein